LILGYFATALLRSAGSARTVPGLEKENRTASSAIPARMSPGPRAPFCFRIFAPFDCGRSSLTLKRAQHERAPDGAQNRSTWNLGCRRISRLELKKGMPHYHKIFANYTLCGHKCVLWTRARGPSPLDIPGAGGMPACPWYSPALMLFQVPRAGGQQAGELMVKSPGWNSGL
jgi:hypothetical protein